jgi:thymidylate kinase
VKHLAIEGLDGTGKSHIASELARATGATTMATPDMAYSELRAILHSRHPTAAFFLYLSSCAYAIERIAECPDSRVILDRYYFSSVVQLGWRQKLPSQDTVDLLDRVEALLPAPGLTIVLVATRESRLRRLQLRPSVGYGELSQEYEKYWHRCVRHLVEGERHSSVLVVNTTADDTTPILKAILDHPFVRRMGTSHPEH